MVGVGALNPLDQHRPGRIPRRNRLSFPHAAALLGEALGKEVLAWQAPTRWVYDLDCTKARVRIGYKPKWTIERMIEAAAS